MELTKINIWFPEHRAGRVLAYCSVVFEHKFVLEDLKVVQGDSGIFIAMPSKKRSYHCFQCSAKNPFTAHYCQHCGEELIPPLLHEGLKLYQDIFHPNSNKARQELWAPILQAYYQELQFREESTNERELDSPEHHQAS